MPNPNFKARIMGQKYTKKSSLRKSRIGEKQKIDSEKKRKETKAIGRPVLPTRWVSENIDKIASGAKVARSLITTGVKALWRGSPHIIAGKAIGDYIGIKTGRRDKDPNTLTGSRALDFATYPLNLMWKEWKAGEQRYKDSKKGIYRDSWSGQIIRKDS
jgi:hypothetical protein